ncbi:MAG: asparagine synthetase B, partial [Planctomycetaceae bacterium]|nr:asparagine synthetase B [Planctomycetaceae bacterium]
MGEAIAHRGPDGHGSFVDGPMALAHRRLAIIDLTSAAAQPMASADGRYVLIFNGEIYNYRELRPVLTAAGCVFRSQSDTEVLLNALITWGEEALPRLNGMFAFAFWDSWERRLLLARDRYGIKPLYISQRGNSLIFGSEVKALLEHPDCSAEVDPDALVEYFTF